MNHSSLRLLIIAVLLLVLCFISIPGEAARKSGSETKVVPKAENEATIRSAAKAKEKKANDRVIQSVKAKKPTALNKPAISRSSLTPLTHLTLRRQMFGSGQVKASSENFIAVATGGQVTEVVGSSEHFEASNDFWQEFGCCLGSTGNVDDDPAGIVDIADLTFLIDHLFINFPLLGCPEEGNVDGDGTGVVDIADLTFLIDHLFINFPPTASCL